MFEFDGDFKYMMATEAFVGSHDISREPADLAIIHGEDGPFLIGNWVTGLGFVNVRFPKDTTRELNQEEKDFYNKQVVNIAGHITPLRIP